MQIIQEDTKPRANQLKYKIMYREASGVNAAGYLVFTRAPRQRSWNGAVRYDTLERAQKSIDAEVLITTRLKSVNNDQDFFSAVDEILRA